VRKRGSRRKKTRKKIAKYKRRRTTALIYGLNSKKSQSVSHSFVVDGWMEEDINKNEHVQRTRTKIEVWKMR
jgi:hypothetical protein